MMISVPPEHPRPIARPGARSSVPWEAIRTEYQVGTYVRALARRHGIHESSIRQMARLRGWTRDPQAAERIRQTNLPSSLDRIAERYFPRRRTAGQPFPLPAATPGAPADALTGEVAKELERARAAIAQAEADALADIARRVAEARAVVGEAEIAARADLIAKANLDHLEQLEKLRELFHKLSSLLGDYLQIPEDEAGRQRQAQARAVLLPGHRDRISSHLLVLCKLMLQIQNQTYRALGLTARQPPRSEPQPTAAGTTSAQPDAELVAKLARLTPEQLAALVRADELLSGKPSPSATPDPAGTLDDAEPDKAQHSAANGRATAGQTTALSDWIVPPGELSPWSDDSL